MTAEAVPLIPVGERDYVAEMRAVIAGEPGDVAGVAASRIVGRAQGFGRYTVTRWERLT